MADAEINFALQAMDEYSGIFDDLQSQLDALSGVDIDIGIRAEDEAGEVVAEIQDRIDQLDGMDAHLSVSADDQASDVLDLISGKLDDLEVKASNFSDFLTAGFAGGIGGMVAGEGAGLLDQAINFFTDMPGKAAESESAAVRLQLAVEKSGVSWSSAADQTNRYIDALSKAVAIDDEKLMDTAASLLFMGMNYDTAMRTLAASLDLAAARQMDIESAARLLGRAWQGNYSILERYGVVLDDQVKKSGDFMAALDALGQKFGGVAVQMANTMEGEMKRAGNAWENFQEFVGGGINWLGKSLMGGLNWLFGQKPAEATMPSAPTIDQGVTVTKISYGKDLWTTTSLQGGGIITKPTRALLGEAGPEAVIPLSRVPLDLSQTVNLNINVRGATIADLQFASEVGRELARLNILSGGTRGWY